MAFDASDLNREVGGVPVWGWAAAVAGGILIARTIMGRRSSDDPETVNVPGVNYQTQGPLIPAGQVITALQGGTLDTSGLGGTATPITQEEWISKAVRVLVAQGVPPLKAHGLVQRYTDGSPILKSEAVLLDSMLAVTGVPPWSVPTINVVDDPVNAPVPTPAPVPPPAPVPNVAPAPAPETDRERFLRTAQEIYDLARVTNDEGSLGRNFGPQTQRFEQMAFMGFKSNDANLNPYVRFFYGLWLNATGRQHLTH